ncbi:MAG: aminotransferase class V-fold PLP-dependent enzyme [Verrucomicrobiota bacterium]
MIYLDHNATTPVAPEVLEAMMPYLTTEWGNPSSSYRFGSKIRAVIGRAREQVSALIGASSGEVYFTGCATESNNAAINAALKAAPQKREIITSAVEHSSVLNHCMALEKENYRVTYLPVDRDGLLKVADLEGAITERTAIVSLMWANNETGVLFPVEEIGRVCKQRGVLFHCDAVQAAGKVSIDVRQVGADYLSLTGHKLNAPKGVGAVYVRRTAPFSPLVYGGHQEAGRRGGTENVAFIVGMGKGAELGLASLTDYDKKVRAFRDALENGILEGVPGCELNGHKALRLGNTSNISFKGVESEALLLLLDEEGICASSGSACLADSDEPSHVLKAMKPETSASREAIRLSCGISNAEPEIQRTIITIEQGVRALREVRVPAEVPC